ncbi:hypothetical protein [Streptomyces canus]|uniref:hypothetical protein n=1 Tax=Streptomyces canus TaxID=58343 RepID=UPI002E2FF5A4|nr:hypothetical protein [Streptomyces canus]
MDAVTYVVAGVGPAPDLDLAVPGRIRDAGEQAAISGRRADPASWPRPSTPFAGLVAAQLPTMPLDLRAHRIAVARHGFFP